MELSVNTPALLFPCISLLLLAYTNRFLAIAGLIRGLKTKYTAAHEPGLIKQINNLRKRVIIIRNMQAAAVLSLFFCVMCMFLIFGGYQAMAQIIFAISLVLMLISLSLSIIEVTISVNALKIELKDLETELDKDDTFFGYKP
ncbi:MAG: DUF2721 domain-containing protein [Bacteroidia bacterium]|nr:DUF2721 domain-containing protein [Bacteroidia bacterium]